LQVTHITLRSIAGSDARGLAAGGVGADTEVDEAEVDDAEMDDVVAGDAMATLVVGERTPIANATTGIANILILIFSVTRAPSS
jgi:hypothetical protein